MFCSNCGGNIPEDSDFCFACGAEVVRAPREQQLSSEHQHNEYLPDSRQSFEQPQYGQPPGKGKTKAILLIAGAAALFLGIAALLISGVFNAGRTTGNAGEGSDVTVIVQPGGSTSGPAAADTHGEKLIGFSLTDEGVWKETAAIFKSALEAKGYHVDIQYAGNDIAKQASQIGDQIEKGVSVLVIASIDPSALGSVLAKAREAGATVIAYGRLLTHTDKCDYCVTSDNYNIGLMQGRYIIDTLGMAAGNAGPFTIECFGGSPEDPSAYMFYQGAMEVLQPYIDSGALIVRSGQIKYPGNVAVQYWESATAESRMVTLLKAYYENENIDAVLSPNDSIAQGVVSALKSAGYGTNDKPFPVLTGQDCDRINVGQIIRGEQSMSIFKDNRDIANQVITMIEAILSGKEVPVNTIYNNGTIDVPSFNCEVKFVDAGNWREVLIDSGYYSEDDIPME